MARASSSATRGGVGVAASSRRRGPSSVGANSVASMAAWASVAVAWAWGAVRPRLVNRSITVHDRTVSTAAVHTTIRKRRCSMVPSPPRGPAGRLSCQSLWERTFVSGMRGPSGRAISLSGTLSQAPSQAVVRKGLAAGPLGSEQALTGVTGGHSLEGVVEIFQRKVVGHHRREVHGTGSDEPSALVPGLPQPAAADPHDMGGLEYDVVIPVEGESPGRHAEQGGVAAGLEQGESLVNGGRGAGHLEQNVDTFAVGRLAHDVEHRVVGGGHRQIGAHAASELDTKATHVRGLDC